MIYPIKSLLFLVGETEFADSPAAINRHLFCNLDPKWVNLDVVIPGMAQVQLNTKATHARGGSRLMVAVRFIREDSSEFIQPFYRSSGLATPDVPQAGEWWPCSGVYTEAYCRWRNMSIRYEGHIGKHQRVTVRHKVHGGPIDVWIGHEKDRSRVHAHYQVICDLLAKIPVGKR